MAGTQLKGVTFSLDSYGAGRIYWDESNTISQPFYATLNGTVRLEGKRWGVDIWAKNITGSHYNLFYFESMSNRFLQRAKGATVGVRFVLEFN